MTQSIVDTFRHLFRCLEIAHHIPGRIRFRLLLEHWQQADGNLLAMVSEASQFQEMIGAIPGIHAIRLNPLACSCVIEYDHRTIPYQAWPDLLAGTPSDAAATLDRIICRKYAEAGDA